MTVQRVTRAGLRRIGETVMTLASAEGLHAHAASVGLRVK
jgi:histidinol dehydrogenase